MLLSFRRVAALLLLLGYWASHCHAQIAIDLSVEVTESDGIFTYVYNLENSDFSLQGINTFLITVADGADVSGIEGPSDDWFGGHFIEPQDRYVGFQTGISADGIRCGVTDQFDIAPGDSSMFTFTSTWAPQPQIYQIGRTISNASDPCFFEGGELQATIDSPSVPPEPLEFDPCDFDKDGDCDAKDIDDLALTITLGEHEAKYEITGDEFVNLDDLNEFLTQTNRINGDADFNGKVEFADFLILSGTFGQDEQRWTEGDFDADGKVAFADFLILSGNFGQGEVAAAALAAVPEPSGMGLLSAAIFGFCGLRRKRNEGRDC